MTNRRILSLLAVLCVVNNTTKAQTPFNTIDSININRINASVLVHGDMWWDPGATKPHCSYPNGTGIDIAITGGIWMSGYDAGGDLHIAAQTYRQRGTDFWPGPLDASDTLTYATSQQWAKVWKLSRHDIQIFQALSATGSATPSNTAATIWEWPAKGNTGAKGNGGVSLNITEDMAPFIDVNGNGIYEPLQGDYPDVEGDQALWWVFSDNGATHSETHGNPLKTEVHAMAYAYNRGNSIDNVVYYQYKVKNKSANNYQQFRIGQLADMDLGMYNDDYIGFDSTRAMGYIYNADTADDLYGKKMPMAGVILHSAAGAGSFMYYINNTSAIGYPVTDVEHNNYMRSRFKDSTHAINDFAGPAIATTGYGMGTPANYLFTGTPGDLTQWSECTSGNTAADRLFVITSGDMTLNAGATAIMNMILVTTPLDTTNACGSPGVGLANIRHVADTAIAILEGGGLPPIPLNIANAPTGNAISIYPNPTHSYLYIDVKENDASISVYNVMGRLMTIVPERTGHGYKLDISGLSAGLYNLIYCGDELQTSMKFIKE